jgi:hypothetical protein
MGGVPPYPRGQPAMGTRASSDFSVDLGPRADADPLAREIRRRVTAKLERGEGLAAFRSMWGTVVVVAVGDDGAGGTSHTTLTLRFDWGRLMIHEGRVGRPDVTLWGSPDSILGLGAWGRLPAWVGRLWFPELPEELPPGVHLSQAGGLPGAARTAGTPAGPGVQSSWSPLHIEARVPHGERRPKGLKIYGGARHPRFVWRLARLLANPG